MKKISFDEAKRIVDENIAPIQRTEILKIKDLVKFNERVLAKDIISGIDIPPFDKSAVDGYTVKSEDTQNASLNNPIKLKLIGSVFAGQTSKNKTTLKEIKSGECMYVTTGSMLPINANAVVMIEDTERKGKEVKIFKPVKLWKDVAKKGEDIKKGDVVLKKGEILTPAKIGVLTAIGVKEVEVYSIPKVAVISTGNEIVDVGKNLRNGEIYDINSYTLAAIVKKAGCIPVRYKIVRDDEKASKKILDDALKYDVVVISGGSSVGEKDLLSNVIESLGKILFHGINIKPGKPTLFGNVKGKPIFGMPGNPTSCLMNAYIFLLPALRKIAHLPFERKKVKAKMSEKFINKSDRDFFVTVKLEDGYAKIVYKTSGAITSMSDADGFIKVPTKGMIEKDEEVEVNLF